MFKVTYVLYEYVHVKSQVELLPVPKKHLFKILRSAIRRLWPAWLMTNRLRIKRSEATTHTRMCVLRYDPNKVMLLIVLGQSV